MILKILRKSLGHLIILGDTLTRPKAIQRSNEAQEKINQQMQNLSVYQFYACPFCIKTRRVIRQLNLPIAYKDAQKQGQHRDDLEKLGGHIKVPCLRIQENGQDQWMYESNNIIAYLNQRFDAAT